MSETLTVKCIKCDIRKMDGRTQDKLLYFNLDKVPFIQESHSNSQTILWMLLQVNFQISLVKVQVTFLTFNTLSRWEERIWHRMSGASLLSRHGQCSNASRCLIKVTVLITYWEKLLTFVIILRMPAIFMG